MRKLTPKQKKIAAAVAVGAVLALLVLIRRKPSATQDGTANPAYGTGLPADYAAAAGGTFADNGASAGQLSSNVADLTSGFNSLAEVLTGALSTQQEQQAKANGDLAAQLANIADRFTGSVSAPGPAGDIGSPIAVTTANTSNETNAARAPVAPAPSATASRPQATTGNRVQLESGGWAEVGSIVQKPSAAHGGRMSNFRVNSNGSLTWRSYVSK